VYLLFGWIIKQGRFILTKLIEVLDALPGCGKTTAVFDYMAKNQEHPWLYLSPMKKEINERVPAEADKTGIEFFIASEREETEDYRTKAAQVLEALASGDNVACTHNLMLRFSQQHLDFIRAKKYRVVCDEELDLISGYNDLKKGDVKFLLENGHISIDEADGRVSFLTELEGETRYSEVKRFADFGCLYSAKSRSDFLVIQISPRMIDAAEQFILLTYNYGGSIMDTFMRMHGYSSCPVDYIRTYKSTEEVRESLKSMIELVDTAAIRQWHKRTNTLSATWWKTGATPDDIEELSKDSAYLLHKFKKKSADCMITLPKSATFGRRALKHSKISIEDSYVVATARATNEFAHKSLAIHLLNIYPLQPVKVYMQDMGFDCNDDVYALNTFIQWLFRGCIRKGEPIRVAIFAKRMQDLLVNWLDSNGELLFKRNS
jgi:hypothetical protein